MKIVLISVVFMLAFVWVGYGSVLQKRANCPNGDIRSEEICRHEMKFCFMPANKKYCCSTCAKVLVLLKKGSTECEDTEYRLRVAPGVKCDDIVKQKHRTQKQMEYYCNNDSYIQGKCCKTCKKLKARSDLLRELQKLDAKWSD